MILTVGEIYCHLLTTNINYEVIDIITGISKVYNRLIWYM